MISQFGSLAQVSVQARELAGEKRLVGYLVGKPEEQLPEFDEIRAALLKDLPEYMVPSSFVVLEGLPLTPNGKLDTRALPDPEVVSGQVYRAPRSSMEVLLCALYEELTGASQVGLDDGFFALGGDSITSIRLVSRARQSGLGFSVRDVFAHPTVAALAQVAQAVEQDVLSVPAPTAGPIGLTPIQYDFLTEGGPLGRFHQAICVEPPLGVERAQVEGCLLYTSPSPRDQRGSRMPSSA